MAGEEEIKKPWPSGYAEAKSVEDFDFFMTGKDNEPLTKIPKSRLAEVVGVVGESMPAIQGGAAAETAVALPAGPTGYNRFFDASWGYWKYNNIVLKNPTGTDGIPEGSDGQLYWNGTTEIWSISKMQALPIPQGVPVINPIGSGLPTEKATADYVDIQVDANKQDILNSIANNSINVETVPLLTTNRYISSNGAAIGNSSDDWNASIQFESLKGATILGYNGNFGTTSTRLAFYSSSNESSFISAVPSSDRLVTSEDFNVPAGAKYYRASCFEPLTNGFKITLKNVPLIKNVPLSTFDFVGNNFVYQNDAIKESNIVWNDGSTGRVVYSDWDESEATYKSFVATSVENGIQATQPAVTFNSQGQITNYPALIFTNI